MILPKYTIRKVVKLRSNLRGAILGDFEYILMKENKQITAYYNFEKLLEYIKENKFKLNEVINV